VIADQILTLLSAVRICGADRWIARCPAHEDHNPSLSLKQADDRILIYCHAGCTVAEICAAIGVTVTDLFDGSRHKLHPVGLRAADCEAGIRRALTRWRKETLRACAMDLRERDELIQIARVSFEAGTIDKETLVHALGVAYNGYSLLEYRFWQLLRDDLFSDLELWRLARREAA